MKVLVTGGAGFIGSHIVDALIRQGDRPVVVDDLSTGCIENVPAGIAFHQVDIQNHPALEEIFEQEQPEIVCHHAAQMDVRKSMRDPCFDAQVNILGSLNAIALSVKYGVRKLILASTSAVYPEKVELPAKEEHPVSPASAYGLAKHVIERYLHLYSEMHGLRYAALRYGNVYGPRQNPYGEAGVIAIFAQQILTNIKPTIFGDGSKTRDYVAVEDVVRANLMAMNGKGDGVFNVGWGKEISDFEVFDAIRKVLCVQIEPVYKTRRPGELTRVCLDASKAQRELGWTPRITFEQGIAATVSYYVTKSAIFAADVNALARNA